MYIFRFYIFIFHWHFLLPLCFDMLISDIRMKSRAVSLPNSQSATSRIAHHKEHHPGTTSSSHPILIHYTAASYSSNPFFFFSQIEPTLIYIMGENTVYLPHRVLQPQLG